jgi:hypothetical protein
MTTLVCDNALFDVFIETGLLDELYAWFDAHGILRVGLYLSEPITIVDSPDGRMIRYTVLVGDPEAEPPVTEARACPLRVEPPAYWPGGE